jgi:hypothetical protein
MMRYQLIIEWLCPKRQKIVNVEKNREKNGWIYTVGRNLN